MFQKKTFRYYYWLVLEFFKKHVRLIIISFFVSFITIVGFLSISPFIKIALTQEEVVGLIGNYDLNNPPDELSQKISNGLVTVSEKGEIIPVVANSWEVMSDGREYRFHLKENLLWGDGKKFSAQDIKYQFADITVTPVDDRTIDFVLNKPLGIFPTYLNKPLLKYPLVGVAGYYKVGKIKTENGYLKEVSLTPNTKNIAPLKYRFYANDSQLLNAYKRGEINEMTVTKKSIADTFLNWKNTKVSKSVDYTRLLTIFFNFNNPIFKSKDLRDAFSMLINTEKLSESGEIAKGPIPPNSWAADPELKSPIFDLENAKKIIEKEITASESAKLKFVTFFDYYDVADEYIGVMEAAGLYAELNVASFNRPDNFDMFLAFLKVPVDPDQYYFWHSTQKAGNIGSYSNVKADLLLEKGRSTINIEDREKDYFDLQKTLLDDPPAIFLYYPYVYTIKRK